MRIVHFSASSVGGAGNAAKSLHLNLVSSGLKSEFHFLSGNLSPDFPNTFRLSRGPFETIRGKLNSVLSQIISSDSYFSPRSCSLSAVTEVVSSYNPSTTILHFHNWFNITNLDQIAFLKKRGFRIVCTLHDERIYTGGCHYAIDCKQFQTACMDCPSVKFSKKLVKSSFINSKNLDLSKLGVGFIAPSKWILGRASQSDLLSDAKISFIPNVITIPSPVASELQTKRTRSSQQGVTIGVASMNPKNPIKGGDLIADLIPIQKRFGFNLIFMRDFRDIRHFWAEIDFLLVPSIIDNSPNVIHEAKLRSIPIVATKVGGITEMLSEFDIELKELSVSHFLESLSLFLAARQDSESNAISSNFLAYLGNPLDSHISLYKQMIESGD